LTTGNGIGSRFAALGAGEALARVASFALTVYLARVLGPAMYGVIGVVLGVMLYATQVADGGIELVGVPLVARSRDTLESLVPAVITARLLFAAVLAVAVAAVGVLAAPQPDGALLAASGFAVLATAMSTRWVHLGLERTGWIALARIAGELASLALVVVMVHETGDVVHVPMALVLGVGVTSGLLLYALRRTGLRLVVRWDWATAAPVFARARHLLLFTLLGLLLFNFDLIFLRFARGPESAGYYAAAYTLIAFAANMIVAFAHTVMPALARLQDDAAGRQRLYATSVAQAFAVALPVAVGGVLVAPDLVTTVFGNRFHESVVALQWLLWTVPLAALRELPVVALVASHAERRLLRVNVMAVGANVLLVIALVPRWGLVGAAVAMVATEAVRLVLALVQAGAVGYRTPLLHRSWRAIAAAATMAAVLLLTGTRSLWLGVPIGAMIYAAMLVFTGGLRLRGARMPSLDV
jgi:PST family polysaccharide transporter